MRVGTVLTILVIATLFLALAIPTVSGQADTVDLQVKLARGDTIYYTSTANVQMNLAMGPLQQQKVTQGQARLAVRVLDVDAEGTMLVEAVSEDLRMISEGQTSESIDKPMLIKVRPDGKVVERLIEGTYVDDFPIALPGRPVRVGESWTRQMTFNEAGIVGTGTITVTLTGIDQEAGGRVARLEAQLDGTVTATPDLTGTLPPGVQAEIGGTLRGTSKASFAVERGRLLGGTTNLVVDVQMTMTGQGQTISGSVKVTMMTEDRPLAAEDVKVPAIAPSMVIGPGKSIGPVSLDLPVAEVTSRLGEPTTNRAFNHRSTVLIWPNQLGGHIEDADPTKLVGLQTSDRTYRTEKGIGFGSSQGAVLFAYGITPARLEMSDPDIGGVRMLIYDEQGIAFAITSDKTHAARGPNHAPVGAVDWITVFPPGGAAKIYPMP